MELLIKSVFSFGLKSSNIDKIKENRCCCCKETLDFYGALCSLSQTHNVGSACSYNAYMWEDAASAFALSCICLLVRARSLSPPQFNLGMKRRIRYLYAMIG